MGDVKQLRKCEQLDATDSPCPFYWKLYLVSGNLDNPYKESFVMVSASTSFPIPAARIFGSLILKFKPAATDDAEVEDTETPTKYK